MSGKKVRGFLPSQTEGFPTLLLVWRRGRGRGVGIPHKKVLDSHQKNFNYSVCKTLKKTNLGMAQFFLTLKNTIFS